jgi:hypothetical protein
MRRAYCAALTLLLFATPTVLAQSVDLSIKGDGVTVVKVDKVIVVKEDLTVVKSFPFTVTAPTGAGLYFWTYPAGVQAADKGDVLEVTNGPKGAITISVKSISAKLDKDGKFVGFDTKFGSVSFAIGDVPVPPDPKPPVPPDPKPDPVKPAPIPLPGFRILIVEESDAAYRKKLSLGQFNFMFGKTSFDWLSSICTNEGGQPGYRIYDKEATGVNDAQQWPRDALKRPRGSELPWIIISNGTTGFEGPLPATESDCKALVQKYMVK